MEELRAGFDDPAVPALRAASARPPGRPGRTGSRRSSGRERPSGIAARIAALAARSIPNGFSREQVLARFEGRDADLLVQVVRHGAVDGLDRRVGEQVPVVGRERGGGVESCVPPERRLVDVADRGDHRPHAERSEMHPACGGAGELAAHQAAADRRRTRDLAVSHGRSPSGGASSRPGRDAG